jgi:rhomboid protease GluP
MVGDRMNITLSKNDEIVMRLIHYFITEKNYNPIVLHGAKDEIWLENTDEEYQIVRIVTNYIHNDEQLDFDLFRTRQIMKKIGRKIFSFNMKAISIFVNLGENVNLDDKDYKNIDIVYLEKFKDLKKYDFIIENYPNILEYENDGEKGLELFVKITEEINSKNVEEATKAEETFKKKTPIITFTLIALNIIAYLFITFKTGDFISFDPNDLFKYGGLVNYHQMENNYELYRIITSMFLHGNLLHFGFNMYALYILGSQIESFFGKTKYLFIYFVSGIIGNLLTMIFLNNSTVSIGASGAIFGLLGSMIYFGYHYRVYFGQILKEQLIPLVIFNLVISMLLGFNNIAHLGGIMGGYVSSQIVGVKYKTDSVDRMNGIIILSIFTIFLCYMIFGR